MGSIEAGREARQCSLVSGWQLSRVSDGMGDASREYRTRSNHA